MWQVHVVRLRVRGLGTSLGAAGAAEKKQSARPVASAVEGSCEFRGHGAVDCDFE